MVVNIIFKKSKKGIDISIKWCYNILAIRKSKVVRMPEWRNWQTPGT